MTTIREIPGERLDIPSVERDLQKVPMWLEEMRRAREYCPPVNEDGSSECPFAEELYWQKLQKEKECLGWIGLLERHQTRLEPALQIAKGNLVVLSAHREQLHGNEVKKELHEAEVAAAAQCKRLARLLERLREAIQKLKEAYGKSAAKQFPGREPRERPFQPAPVQADGNVPQAGGVGRRGELGNLHDIGRDRIRGPSLPPPSSPSGTLLVMPRRLFSDVGTILAK